MSFIWAISIRTSSLIHIACCNSVTDSCHSIPDFIIFIFFAQFAVQIGDAENAGPETAGQENDGPNRRAGN